MALRKLAVLFGLAAAPAPQEWVNDDVLMRVIGDQACDWWFRHDLRDIYRALHKTGKPFTITVNKRLADVLGNAMDGNLLRGDTQFYDMAREVGPVGVEGIRVETGGQVYDLAYRVEGPAQRSVTWTRPQDYFPTHHQVFANDNRIPMTYEQFGRMGKDGRKGMVLNIRA